MPKWNENISQTCSVNVCVYSRTAAEVKYIPIKKATQIIGTCFLYAPMTSEWACTAVSYVDLNRRPKTPIKGFRSANKKLNKAKSERDIWDRYFNLILKMY